MEVPAVPAWVVALISVALAFILRDIVGERLQARVTKKRLAAALYSEVEAIWDRYTKVIGHRLQALKPGDPLDVLGGLVRSQGFFSVYDRNTDKLGLFAPKDASKIVRAYTLAKAHAESLNQAGDRVRTEYADIFAAQSMGLPLDILREEHVKKLQAEIGKMLKDEYEELAKAMTEVSEVLRRYAGIR